MHRAVKVVVALAGFLLLPSIVFAQATIAGIVRDSSASVLPGVTVEASSPALIEKTRTVVSDGTGQYRMTDVPPGKQTYEYQTNGAAWLTPTAIAAPRLARFHVTLNF